MSGLPPMPTNLDLSQPDPVEAYSPADLNAFLSSYSPNRQPGTQYEYSNLGVALLGRLLAGKTGRPYEDLIRARVLAPLGMTSTSISLSPEQARRLAPGHDRYLQLVHTSEMNTLQGSGSLRSSANDLLTFLEACLGYRSTPLAAALQFQREAVRRPFPGGVQLLGWSERASQGITVLGHDGGKEGYRAAVLFNPVTRVGVVILANARTDDTPIALAVHLLTGRRLRAAPSAPTQTLVDVSRDLLDAYAGRYTLASGAGLQLARKDTHLIMDMPGNGITEFYPSAIAEFRSNTSDETLRIRTTANGHVTGLEYLSGTRSSEAVRND
jgi:CubicO group peptidase (beta-lactamase class C family)